jgi:ORF6N domain
MFRLLPEEWQLMRSQIAISQDKTPLRSQIVILEGKGRHSKYLPFAFTEHGIAMLSGVLNSEKAIQMNISIMRAFVEARRLSLLEMDPENPV